MKIIDQIKLIRSYWPVTKFYFYSLFKKNQPLFGLFFQITNKCNARCLMCFNWKILNKIRAELTLDEIKKVATTLGPVENISLGGGEPFLRDDLVAICKIFYKINNTRKIAIPTNCLLPDRITELSAKIIEACPVKLKIILSLDGIGKMHDYIRGVPGAFDKVLETYKKLNQLSQKNPAVQISINTTISDKNQNEIKQIIDFVDEKLPVRFHTLEIIRGCYNQKDVQVPTIDKYKLIIKDLLKSQTLKQNKYHKIMYTHYHHLALEILKKEKQIIPCRISSFMPVIDATGNVYNCELLPPIGNLKQVNYDFKKIWQSNKAKEQRKNIISKKKCYCTHYCYQIQNIPMSPWQLLKIVKSKY